MVAIGDEMTSYQQYPIEIGRFKALQHPLGREAYETSITDDDVVQDLDAHQLPGVLQPAGDLPVLPARGRVA